MSPVDKAFAAFDKSLNLDSAERLTAQARHHEIRAALEEAGLIGGSFLQGSFARKTMLKPLKDVDIVCLLAASCKDEFVGPGGPARALDAFRSVVSRRWPGAGFDEEDPPAGKALRVSFPDCHFTVDLVAGIDTDDELIYIGDRDDDRWMPSTTRRLIRLVSTRNQATGGQFVHQVRMLKSLKHEHRGLAEVTGIVFEALTFEVVTRPVSHKYAVSAVLKHAAIATAGPIYDPALENDLTEKWSRQQRDAIVNAFGVLAQRAVNALELEAAGDPDAALDLWHSVFGADFPAPDPRSPKAVMEAWAMGSVTESGRPVASAAGAYAVPPGRGWLAR